MQMTRSTASITFGADIVFRMTKQVSGEDIPGLKREVVHRVKYLVLLRKASEQWFLDYMLMKSC